MHVDFAMSDANTHGHEDEDHTTKPNTKVNCIKRFLHEIENMDENAGLMDTMKQHLAIAQEKENLTAADFTKVIKEKAAATNTTVTEMTRIDNEI